MQIGSKSIKLIRRILGNTYDAIEDFLPEFNNAVDDINYNFDHFTILNNNSQLLEDIEIGAGLGVTTAHRLGVVPKYRIIAKQVGNGLVTDGNFNSSNVTFINNGASSVTISVILFKE